MNTIPQEMRQYNQWMVGVQNAHGEFKVPAYWNGSHVVKGDPSNPLCHMSFVDACNCAASFGLSIGFALMPTDPFTVIDLDVKNSYNLPTMPNKWTTTEELQRYERIIAAFSSYTEISSGGYGVHIVVKGDIGDGKRRDGVEVYSKGRFMVCTGKSIHTPARPIVAQPEYLQMLVDEIVKSRQDSKIDLVEVEPTETDEAIWQKASTADNSDKFNLLFKGDWRALNYPSQSEADLALMSMFTYYSESNEQCRRLFRYSALGKREKAIKNNRYLDFTLSLCRARQQREKVQFDEIANQAKNYIESLNAARETTEQIQRVQQEPVSIETTNNNVVIHDGSKNTKVIDWPPGLTGEIARFIYSSSMRPIKEVAVVTALGFLSGVCGKAWYIPQSGLNGYYILIAPSGIGKEAMNTGISIITSQLSQQIPASGSFVCMDKFASGPALRKHFAKNQSFVNLHGEIGKMIKRMATDPAGGPMATFRADLTDIYQKSGPSSRVSGVAYSNGEQNTQTTVGVAFSLMGETTPGQFFESLTKDMMEDGFLSRFHIIMYDGDRPPLNKNPIVEMSPNLFESVAVLVTQALTLNSRYQNMFVPFDEQAEQVSDDFNDLCDVNINKTKDEAIRQAWNRAHLKMIRLAALLAVADNCLSPVVRLNHVLWAKQFVEHGLNLMLTQWKNGAIGVDDETRNLSMCHLLNTYLKDLYRPVKRMDLRNLGIITKSDLVTLSRGQACFYKHRLGHMAGLNNTINDFVSMGMLVPVNDQKKHELKFSGQGWYIMEDLESFMKEAEQ